LQYDHKWISYLSERLLNKITSSVSHVIRNGDPVNGYPGILPVFCALLLQYRSRWLSDSSVFWITGCLYYH